MFGNFPIHSHFKLAAVVYNQTGGIQSGSNLNCFSKMNNKLSALLVECHFVASTEVL